jgi:U3 small nucleolar RNA-associated protein 20
LDPFTPLLVDALFSKYNRVLSLAARIWSYYIVLHASLPSLRRALPRLTTRLVSLVQRGGDTSSASELMQACCKALTIMIREVDATQLRDDMLEVLLSFIREDLENVLRQKAVFGLLRAIIGRKFASAQIYTLMDAVSRVLVQSQSETSRNLAQGVRLWSNMHIPISLNQLLAT